MNKISQAHRDKRAINSQVPFPLGDMLLNRQAHQQTYPYT